jgi:predicted ATPase
MIKSIKLDNFFSFQNEEVIFNKDSNILVGINGSGKSNILKALTLLKVGVMGNNDDTALEELIVSRYGGFDSIYCKSNEDTEYKNSIALEFVFDSRVLSSFKEFDFYKKKGDVHYKIVIIKVEGTQSYFLSEKIYAGRNVYLDFYNGTGKISERDEGTGRVGLVEYKDYFPSQSMALSQISGLDTQKYHPLLTLKNAIKDISIYNYFDTTSDSKLRGGIRPISTNSQLLSNGVNLTQILNFIKQQHKLEYKKIKEKLNDINPNFVDIDFFIEGSGLISLMLEEEGLGSSIHVSQVSDGTLRYLCLMAILYNPKKGKVICIDEPEVGLHPDMIHNVAKAIREASDDSMVIVSTHSSELLNYFSLDKILVFDKGEGNSTEVDSFTEEEFAGWYENFMPGKMWRNGDLGGKRWQ